MTLSIITEPEELFALQPVWHRLWLECPNATPFQSPQWLLAWWQHFGEGRLQTFAIKKDGELIGLVPGFEQSEQTSGQTRFSLLGGAISDYLDALVYPNVAETLSPKLLGLLTEEGGLVNARFEPVRTDSLLLQAWRAGQDDGPPSEVVNLEICPFLDLRGATRLREVIPARQAENCAYYRRRADRLGSVSFERAGSDNWQESLRWLFQLHEARWRARHAPGVLADPSVQRFHIAVAGAFARLGILRLYLMRLEERPVAVLYGFQHRARFYYYLGGFDPELAAISPGSLLLAHAIEQALAERVLEFDFLRGAEQYKYLWGAQNALCHSLTLKARTGPKYRSASPAGSPH